MTPNLIPGGNQTDSRGTISFVNDFDMSEVKRLYVVEHPDTSVVRAWQGHKMEQKWFYVVTGSFKVVIVKPDDWNQPSSELPMFEFELSSGNSEVLHIPGGHLNGIRALTPGSKMIIFSDATVEQSKADDYRFDSSNWYSW